MHFSNRITAYTVHRIPKTKSAFSTNLGVVLQFRMCTGMIYILSQKGNGGNAPNSVLAINEQSFVRKLQKFARGVPNHWGMPNHCGTATWTHPRKSVTNFRGKFTRMATRMNATQKKRI